MGYSPLCVKEQLVGMDWPLLANHLLCFGVETHVPLADGNVPMPFTKDHGSTEVMGFKLPPVTAGNVQEKQVRRTRGA